MNSQYLKQLVSLPSVKDDGREQVDEKYILAEDKNPRVPPIGEEQDHAASEQPLQASRKNSGGQSSSSERQNHKHLERSAAEERSP